MVTSQTFPYGAVDFSTQYRTLRQNAVRVIVIMCSTADSGRFIQGAIEHGIGGSGFLWFGSDSLSNDELWLNNEEMSTNASLRLRLLKGFFGARAWGGGGVMHTNYLERLRRMQSTTGKGDECNLQTDDDIPGNILWAGWPGSNSSSPIICAGTDGAVTASDSFAPYAYDGMYALARALHELIEGRNVTEVLGPELMQGALPGASNFA